MGPIRWFEHRTGLGRASRHLLEEPIPSATGWRNTLGSLAGGLLLAQIVTGVLLALYYVPHPDAAYASVEYVEREITLGWFVRALHYWGASFIVIALFLHMLRVFFSGAYRAPRELTWVVGLALFGLVLILAFTGQLLPWNEMGYWAASVGSEIVSSIPYVGAQLKELMLGGETIGALTLTRFYALHMVILPVLLGALVYAHLYLLRRHGPMRPANDASDSVIPFFPNQATRDLVVVSAGLLLLAGASYYLKGPESKPLNLEDTSFTPRPEWYFLAHYELLRMTPGSMKVAATFILPSTVILLLLLLPWFDRKTGGTWRQRPVLVTGMSVFVTALVGLTVFGLVRTEGRAEPAADAPAPAGAEYDAVAAGRAVYEREQCRKCHVIDIDGKDEGPDLTGVGLRLREDFLRAFLVNPQAFFPESEMPPTKVSQKELDELVAYLMSLKGVPEP